MDFKGRGINVFIQYSTVNFCFYNDQKEQSIIELWLLVACSSEGKSDSLWILTSHYFGGQVLAASAIVSIFLNIRLVKIFQRFKWKSLVNDLNNHHPKCMIPSYNFVYILHSHTVGFFCWISFGEVRITLAFLKLLNHNDTIHHQTQINEVN